MNPFKDKESNILVSEAPATGSCCFASDRAAGIAEHPQKAWHTHTGLQVLIATDGFGYYQEKGKPVQLLENGAVVFILPHVLHWHTAAAQSEFTEVIIAGQERNELVTWLQKTTGN